MSVLKDESYESIEEILEESTEEEYSTNFDNTASTTTSEIDDMTLSLLMNKTLYKKYISKNEDSTNEYEEQLPNPDENQIFALVFGILLSSLYWLKKCYNIKMK